MHGKALRDDWVERLRAHRCPSSSRALNAIGALPDPVVPEKARGALDALARLLLLAATQLTRLFNAHGECDHTEIAGAARRALTEDSSPTPLAERLGTRLMHILVDEFQDTSRDQYELLRTLTQDWSNGDGRTLFLVGDPMQSIYGFRNAEVGRFSTVRAAGLARPAPHAARAAAQFPLGAGARALVQRRVRARVSRGGRRAQERRAPPGQCRRAQQSRAASPASIASAGLRAGRRSRIASPS